MLVSTGVRGLLRCGQAWKATRAHNAGSERVDNDRKPQRSPAVQPPPSDLEVLAWKLDRVADELLDGARGLPSGPREALALRAARLRDAACIIKSELSFRDLDSEVSCGVFPTVSVLEHSAVGLLRPT
jgi:hypothetical protein